MANDTGLLRVLHQYFNAGVNTSPPLINHAPADWMPPTPAQCLGPRRLYAQTAGTNLVVASWNVIMSVVVANLDPANLLEVGWTYVSATGTHLNVLPVQPGASIAFNGPITTSVPITFMAFNAPLYCDISIIGQ